MDQQIEIVGDPILQRLYIDDKTSVDVRLSHMTDWEKGRLSDIFMGVNNHIYPEFKSDRFDPATDMPVEDVLRFSNIRAVVDENLCSKQALPVLWDRLGYAVHVSTLRLKGASDYEIYQAACQGNWSAIISKDKRLESEDHDLTAIAVRHFASSRGGIERLPIVVQLDIPNGGEQQIRPLIERFAPDIHRAVLSQRTPFIRLSVEHGCEDGRDILRERYSQGSYCPSSASVFAYA
ncbi:MAG: hypothetical protein RBR86_02885 [Pseudobdellovibrionaceae bacterium]|nr:hypothetical protein [Pseudobdellovibrionaceae bacterium]